MAVLTSPKMEQWQFLIQKQGDRAWQSLESPYVEIIEGRYRVVARSCSANTDVEVRVTHLSPAENPPRRRIHKRSRRTNAEGLMAVIPFTYFAVGGWEVRCSGDLMSDILGQPWQQTLHLQVLPISSPTEATTPANDDMGEIEGFVDLMPSILTASDADESQAPEPLSPITHIPVASSLPIPPVPPNFTEITVKNSFSEGSDVNLVSDATSTGNNYIVDAALIVENELPTIFTSDAITQESLANEEKIIERIVVDSDVPIPIADVEAEVNINEPVTAITAYRAGLETPAQANMLEQLTVDQAGELQPLPGAEFDEITDQSDQVTAIAQALTSQFAIETTLPIFDSSDDVTLPEHNDPISEGSFIPLTDSATTEVGSTQDEDITIDEPIILNTSNITVYIRQNESEKAIINQSISPVWVKGDSAEQILQDLIDLALPPSELLISEDANKDSQADNLPLPLLLTLDEQAYIARWGRPLTIYGRAQLAPNTDVSDDTAEFESVLNGELRIKLLEPQGLEVLTQAQQPLREKLLPFGFEFTVEIPATSQSKLLLADISLYGSLTGVENPVLLATQSFIITADVTELLAVSATAKPSEPDMLDYPLAALTPEPEPVVSLDLELFNLVKTAKTAQTQVLQPSPKRALPLTVEKRKPKRGSTRKLQLPFSQGQETTGLSDMDELSTSLPFLKKRPLSPVEEVVSSVVDNSLENFDSDTFATLTDIDNPLAATLAPELPTDVDDPLAATLAPELLADVLNQDDYIENNGDAIPDNSLEEVISEPQPARANRSQVSPLIQKWIQSQGYSLSETINLQYSSLDIPNNVNNAVDEEPLDNDLTVPIIVPEDLTVVESEPVVEPPIDLEVQLPVSPNVKIPNARFAQEIVIDDTVDFISTDTVSPISLQPEAQTLIDNLLNSLPLSPETAEPLPIPQLNLAPGDLISGRTMRVKVLLPKVSSQIVVKLWVEDCQTRWLLEGPHLLTDLFPSTNGQGIEAHAELNIPFGCLEIRIEAISFNLATQQESHKATIQRTVIPPDLPTLQMDELLGI
jgi:hypothetical protein